jgi:hypothetical protein
MPDDRSIDLAQIEGALDVIAEWLIACYGARMQSITLVLEGFYTGEPEYYGILPWIDRTDGETRETLPSREVRDLAERIFIALLPQARITRESSRDVRDIARSDRVAAANLSAHRRLELLDRFGRPQGIRLV